MQKLLSSLESFKSCPSPKANTTPSNLSYKLPVSLSTRWSLYFAHITDSSLLYSTKYWKLCLFPKSGVSSGLTKLFFVGLQKWVSFILSKSVQMTISDVFFANEENSESESSDAEIIKIIKWENCACMCTY